MEESKALEGLLDAADLVAMVENLTRLGNADPLAPSTMAGVRITLRTIREMVLKSHDSLSREMVGRAVSAPSIAQQASNAQSSIAAPSSPQVNSPVQAQTFAQPQTIAVKGPNMGEARSAQAGQGNGSSSIITAQQLPGATLVRKELRASLERFVENGKSQQG